MANKTKFNVGAETAGIRAIPFSFASGAAEDDSFPLEADGYSDLMDILFVDGYGAGYTAFRTGVGEYDIILSEQFGKVVHLSANCELASEKVVLVVPQAPLDNDDNPPDAGYMGKKGTRIKIKLLNASADRVDLKYNERVSGVVWCDNSDL